MTNCPEVAGPVVYAIRNMVTGDAYVGSTRHLSNRMSKSHLPSLRQGHHVNSRLQRAWNKYGAGAFEIVVLQSLALDEDLMVAEQGHIDESGTYNLIPAGFVPSFGGRRHTPEARAKIAARHQGLRSSAETCAKVAASWAVPETRAKKIAGMQASWTAARRAKFAATMARKRTLAMAQ